MCPRAPRGLVFSRQAQPDAKAAWLWSLLIAYNVFFLEGFLNFDLSLAVGLLALAVWLRWLATPGTARWITALVAFTALYFTHLLGFAIAGLIVVAWLALSRRPVRDWLWSGALAVPGVAFYLHSSRVGLGANQIIFHGWDDKLDSLGMILTAIGRGSIGFRSRRWPLGSLRPGGAIPNFAGIASGSPSPVFSLLCSG